MSEVLQGLYACRANIERRIAAAAGLGNEARERPADNDAGENVADLHSKLRCIERQIDAYVHSGIRWDYRSEVQHLP